MVAEVRPGALDPAEFQYQGSYEPLIKKLIKSKTGGKGFGKPEIVYRLNGEANDLLVIEVKGMPLDKIALYGVGWQIHAENLAAYLAGREPDDVEARWEELVPPYQDLAASIS